MTDKLSDRVMALEGPDRKIFNEAFVAIHGPKPERVHGGSQELTDWLMLFNPFYTFLQAGAWLDAAMSLGRDDWERADALVDALQHLGNPDFLTNGEWSKLLPIRVVANLLKLRGL